MDGYSENISHFTEKKFERLVCRAKDKIKIKTNEQKTI